ncbi:DNA methyltransferase [Desulfonema limicola]|uniref:DNA methyltransferase n=1 Tax=Desulfonema limicola TaxID=45656 RepID=UPI001A9BFC48|nr:DNA methyltransferase [Desulfonema limicola]
MSWKVLPRNWLIILKYRKLIWGNFYKIMNHLVKIKSVINKVFDDNIELLPSVNELFELELAYLEYKCLPQESLLERTAYIKSINNQFSKHYLLYSRQSEGLHDNRSLLTQTYFEEGQFSTGYATHGLFPYRGKFHPQLIKGLINILGIDSGELILDPMAGSGTTNIEAALMGIDSYAIDVSPFCQFMIKTKYQALTIDLNLFKNSPVNAQKFFTYFKKGNVIERIEKIGDPDKIKIYNLAFLAYLDALGYSKRVIKSNHEQLFEKVLHRYIETIKSFLANPYYNLNNIGKLEILHNSEALQIKIENDSVDCVITSPPYSFAIDYVENDREQLEFLGYNTKELKNKLIGLKGRTKKEKLENYFADMDKFCSEVSKVLKKGRFFVIIIGSNTNQTGGIRLEETIINSSEKYNMPLIKTILKPIKGMRNTMKNEYILIFERH